MSIPLPEPISVYFAADKLRRAEAISECFTADAIVVDEGKTHAGLEAIAMWASNASTQYTYTVEPFALDHEGDRTEVRAHLVGNFPGSPVDLRYLFDLADDKIARLEIVP